MQGRREFMENRFVGSTFAKARAGRTNNKARRACPETLRVIHGLSSFHP
jgi:hypothetical protein